MSDNIEAVNQEKQLVIFALDKEAYGVDIASVHEIIRMQTITAVPRAPEFVEGVINLRGKVIPVVDMRKRFGLAVSEQTKDSRIVVVDLNKQEIGVIVDAVTEVLRIPAKSIEPPSPVITTTDSTYLLGIAKLEGKLIILLDLEQVLSVSEKKKLATATLKQAEVQTQPKKEPVLVGARKS